MSWKKYFNFGKEIILVTSSKKGKPNASIVVSVELSGNKILIANCHLSATIKNILENKEVCVVGGYYRLKGVAKIFNRGEYFDKCVKDNEGYKYKVQSAVLITVKEVFNLDKGTPIKI